ncbi:MAG: Vacuolar protein sorting-associated protein 53, partial [Paramarteilia canceri]
KMWYEVDEGARQSNYVTVLIQSLKKAVKEVRQGLDLSRHHFITVCKNIVLKVPDMIIDAVLNFHKGITMQQAPGQRLLADSRFIGQYLINIPLLDSDLSSHQLPPDFVTFSNKSVKKFLSILKFMLIEMVDTDIKAMALNFEKIVGESVEESSMVKILKWKGINPSQVNEIISEILKME